MIRAIIFFAAAWLLFTVFVTVFAASAKSNEVRNLPKWLWIIICLLVPIIGGLLYLVFGRPLGGPKPRFGRTKVVAPDDDPQFLRDLAKKLEEEEKSQSPEASEEESDETDDDKENPKP